MSTQPRDHRGRFAPTGAAESGADLLGALQRSFDEHRERREQDDWARRSFDVVDWDRVRPSDRDAVEADLEMRLRHTDGTGMTLRESLRDGRVSGRSLVDQGSRTTYAVAVPDLTANDPEQAPVTQVQVRKATWEAIDLPYVVADPATAPAVGTFRQSTTRDGVGHELDGQEVVDTNSFEDGTSEAQFRDGRWVIVDDDELELTDRP